MITFLENYHADRIFVALMGCSAFVLLCLTLKNIFVTNKIMREKVMALQSLAFLVEKARAFVEKVFLEHIVNNGKIITSEIVIDDSYLTSYSSAYLKMR